MQNDETTLTRSDHIENLQFGPEENPNEVEENGAIGTLHDVIDEDRFFDSRDYRLCWNCIHTKILTFVMCTWIFHEVILSALYLVSIFEEIESKSTIFVVLMCRAVQMVTIGLLYYGLWKHKKEHLLPFIVVQFTLGIFSDISTLLILIRQLEASGEYLPFNEGAKWLNVAIPLIIYFAIVAFLVYVLYSCYNFLNARTLHEKRRQLDKEQHNAALSSHFGLNGSGGVTTVFLQSNRNDSVMPEGEIRSNSPAITSKTQNSIAMHSLSRTPSSQINPRSTKFTAEQLKLRQQLIRQRSGNNPTGSLQQIPSSFSGRQAFPVPNQPTDESAGTSQRRLTSLSSSPYPHKHDQSEPFLHLMSTKNPQF